LDWSAGRSFLLLAVAALAAVSPLPRQAPFHPGAQPSPVHLLARCPVHGFWSASPRENGRSSDGNNTGACRNYGEKRVDKNICFLFIMSYNNSAAGGFWSAPCSWAGGEAVSDDFFFVIYKWVPYKSNMCSFMGQILNSWITFFLERRDYLRADLMITQKKHSRICNC
jgi:hypothetical protein